MIQRRTTARWTAQQPGTLLITDDIGAIVAKHAVRPPGERPGPLILAGTGWAAYPGSEWDEEPPGCWSAAVFPHPLPQRPGSDDR